MAGFSNKQSGSHNSPKMNEAPQPSPTSPSGPVFSLYAPIQRVIMAKQKDTSNETIRQAAQRGVQTPSGQMPYAEQIQKSFGRHDVSHIRAHLGPEATTSTAAMGASAYATGNHVVFSGTPDLHTTAHEATHVVQQQGGIQLSGGVGKVGDPFEHHADVVADRVVSGQSAEQLLDQFAGRQGEIQSTPSSVSKYRHSPNMATPPVSQSMQPQPAIQRTIVGPLGENNLWATVIARKVVVETDESISDAVHRLHSIGTLVRVSSYEDLVERIKLGEFKYLLVASKKESSEAAKYQETAIGKNITTSGTSTWRTGKIAKELQTANRLDARFNTGHHKLPKSTLEWVHAHMTQEQWNQAKPVLDLPTNAGLSSLKSLPSNVAFGPDSGLRAEDPGQGLDLNIIKDPKKGRRMSLRSNVYNDLAGYIASIDGPPRKVERGPFTAKEFTTILGYLESAEQINAVLTGGGLDTNTAMWTKSGSEEKPWKRQALEAQDEIDVKKLVGRAVRDLKRFEHKSKFENPPQVHWPLFVNIGLSSSDYESLMKKEDNETRRSEISREELLHNLHRAMSGKSTQYRHPKWHHGFKSLGDGNWQYTDSEGVTHYYPE